MRTRSNSAEAKWRRIIEDQATSGQTVAEYCRQRGLPASSLFGWKRRLTGPARASAFVEAGVASGDDERAGPGGIEIQLRGGRRVVIQRGFDGAMLGKVVKALESLG